MGQLAIPMMIGAAVGGGTKLLQGKGIGGILKGAALGGALGGATGGIGGLMGEGAAIGAEGVASQGAQGLLGATGAAGTGASLAVPTIAQSIAPEALAGTIESSGMVFNPVTGSYLAPEAYLGASSATPLYTGTGSMLDKLSMGAQSVGSDLSARMPSGIGVDNLLGAGQIAMGQPTQAAPIASQPIKVGQAPSAEAYAQFMQQYYPQYKQKRPDLGLTG